MSLKSILTLLAKKKCALHVYPIGVVSVEIEPQPCIKERGGAEDEEGLDDHGEVDGSGWGEAGSGCGEAGW